MFEAIKPTGVKVHWDDPKTVHLDLAEGDVSVVVKLTPAQARKVAAGLTKLLAKPPAAKAKKG